MNSLADNEYFKLWLQERAVSSDDLNGTYRGKRIGEMSLEQLQQAFFEVVRNAQADRERHSRELDALI